VGVIADAHVAVDSRRYPADAAVEILRADNIRQAVIFADSRAEDLERENRYVLEAARRFGLIPFLYIGGNPYTDTRPAELELPSDLDAYAGIRWHRWIGESPDRHGRVDLNELDWAVSLFESAEFEAVMSAAAHYDMPVIVEESFAVTVELVRRYPSVDFIVPHMGAGNGGEETILKAFWDTPNVYFDTSLAIIDDAWLSRIGIERILFASGYPYGDPDHELEKIESLDVSDEIKEDIFGNNLLRLLHREDDL
jgi:hypothetical protein